MRRALHSATVSARFRTGPIIQLRADADTKTKASAEMAIHRAATASLFSIIFPLGLQEVSDALASDSADDLKGHGPSAVAVLPDLVDGGLRRASGYDAPRLVQRQAPLAGDHFGRSGGPAQAGVGRQGVPHAHVKAECVLSVPFVVADFQGSDPHDVKVSKREVAGQDETTWNPPTPISERRWPLPAGPWKTTGERTMTAVSA